MSSQGRELRRRFMEEFRSFSGKNSLLAAWMIVIAHVGAAAIAAGLSVLSFQWLGYYATPFYVFVIFFIGTRYRALANIIHECCHYAFTSHRNWNVVFGKILSIPLFASFESYRTSHYSHHQHLGDDEKDLDFKGLEGLSFGKMITRAIVIRHFLNTMTLRHVPLYIGRVFYVKTDAAVYNVLRACYVAMLFLILVLSGPLSQTTLLMVAYVIVPYAITLQIITYWQDALDHAGVIKNADELYQTRNSVLGNRVLRSILFPRNDCYHLVHHLFPHIPVADLPASHQALMRDPHYAELDHHVVHRAKSLWWPRTNA